MHATESPIVTERQNSRLGVFGDNKKTRVWSGCAWDAVRYQAASADMIDSMYSRFAATCEVEWKQIKGEKILSRTMRECRMFLSRENRSNHGNDPQKLKCLAVELSYRCDTAPPNALCMVVQYLRL